MYHVIQDLKRISLDKISTACRLIQHNFIHYFVSVRKSKSTCIFFHSLKYTLSNTLSHFNSLRFCLLSITMQILQTPSHHNHIFFSFPKTLNPPSKPHSHRHHFNHQQQHQQWRPLLPRTPTKFTASSLTSDEFPVDETFLENFGPKDKETEDEARIRNWVERGWAPWEEILSPEADFARKSLNEGEEVPLQSPEAIEAFRMLRPSYRKKKMAELGISEDEYYRKQFEIKGEIPEPLQTLWAGPLVVRHLPPRDWPPRGWEVDKEELEFIREAHRLQAVRVPLEGLESEVRTETDGMCLDRYRVFLKQYKEWVDANKDRLEEESYKV